MDQNDPSRRHYAAPPTYTGQTAQSAGSAQQQQQPQPQGQQQQQDPYAAQTSAERYRALYRQHAPAPYPPRSAGDGQSQAFGFAPVAQYGAGPANMLYSQEAQTPEAAHRQQHPQQSQQPSQQQQPYSSYAAASIMSSMAQAPPQQAPPPDTMSSYRPRPGAYAAVQPQPTAHYYLPGQAAPSNNPSADLASAAQYHHTDYAQPAAAPADTGYASAMMDPSQAAAYGHYAQQPQPYVTQQQPQARQHSQQEQQHPPHPHQQAQVQQAAAQSSAQSEDVGFEQYRPLIRGIFTRVREGVLQDIQAPLLQATHLLLDNVEALGLTRDDETQRDSRVALWDEFNRAWLTVLQRQFDLTEATLAAGRSLLLPQSLMTLPTLDYLGRELVHVCDSLERHGLVDYQMGVAEDEIIDILLRCKRLLESPGDEEEDEVPRTLGDTEHGGGGGGGEARAGSSRAR